MSRHLGKAVKRACEGSLCTRDQEPVGKGRPLRDRACRYVSLACRGEGNLSAVPCDEGPSAFSSHSEFKAEGASEKKQIEQKERLHSNVHEGMRAQNGTLLFTLGEGGKGGIATLLSQDMTASLANKP